VIDGGGTHVSIEPSLNIDDLALTNGQSYAFDAFMPNAWVRRPSS